MQSEKGGRFAGIEYRIVRRKRKSVGITVSAENGVVVAAPYWISKIRINEIVADKSNWILKKLAEFSEQARQKNESSLENGKELFLLGKSYRLSISTVGKTNTVELIGETLNVNIGTIDCTDKFEEVLRQLLTGWYKEFALQYVNGRVREYSASLNVSPSKVVVKSQKRLWGSCTGKNTVNINWKIIMAPEPVIDYLVVHELAHLIVRNHSKSFWNVVGKVLPDYKERSKWLKANGFKLNF